MQILVYVYKELRNILEALVEFHHSYYQLYVVDFIQLVNLAQHIKLEKNSIRYGIRLGGMENKVDKRQIIER